MRWQTPTRQKRLNCLFGHPPFSSPLLLLLLDNARSEHSFISHVCGSLAAVVPCSTRSIQLLLHTEDSLHQIARMASPDPVGKPTHPFHISCRILTNCGIVNIRMTSWRFKSFLSLHPDDFRPWAVQRNECSLRSFLVSSSTNLNTCNLPVSQSGSRSYFHDYSPVGVRRRLLS